MTRSIKDDFSNLRPTGDKILLHVLPRAEKSPGGIFLPETRRGRQDFAKVVAVGPGRVLDSGAVEEPRVKKGDVVIFDPYKGQAVDQHGKFLLTRMGDVLAVVDLAD